LITFRKQERDLEKSFEEEGKVLETLQERKQVL
jgi:hypothetical protein